MNLTITQNTIETIKQTKDLFNNNPSNIYFKRDGYIYHGKKEIDCFELNRSSPIPDHETIGGILKILNVNKFKVENTILNIDVKVV